MRAIILGNFDGVHLGHQALLKAAGIAVHSAQDRVRDALSVHVWTFNPPPRSVLSPDFKVERLQRVEDRVRQLHLMGATGVEVIRPTVELLGRSAADFITQLYGDRGFDFIVEGPDFRFGKGREGSMDLLRTLGGKLGFEVIEVPAVSVQLSTGTTVQARSGAIRQLLPQGNVGDAGRILGRPFSMRAQVVRGEQRGRTIGWPTANLDAEEFAQHQLLIPADGVYAGFGRLSQAHSGAQKQPLKQHCSRQTVALSKSNLIHTVGHSNSNSASGSVRRYAFPPLRPCSRRWSSTVQGSLSLRRTSSK